jgi:1-acyl-sn-glycerol-3-phosphate acyltransferase
VLRMLNGVPLDQIGVAKEGFKTVLAQLEGGQAVVMFPEGERTWKGPMQDLKPGIHLLIKKSLAPIVPVGLAGAYQAWPRMRSYPYPAPLFLPAARGCLGVSIGKPVSAESLLALPREQMLVKLHGLIDAERQKAEALRRKF